jgi:hypothetical protein
MITIKEGQLNQFMIRSNDNISATGSLFLFEFESIQSREKFYFIPQNLSTNNRYMEFNVQEITGTTFSYSPTASTSRIFLTYGGQYNYKLYQHQDYSLTASTTDPVIDYGKGLFLNGEYQDFFF